jgi:2-polyprenyl-6-hydroxyphenyl methylase/3-demethylubiquinone-9 3-methyltransferase
MAARGGGAAATEERFDFGANWSRYLDRVDERSIAAAEASLEEMLGAGSLEGRTFLDIGCGSGLFSLAAARLGADHVHSFDYDPGCVECAEEMRRRHLPAAERWTIARGDVTDADAMRSLGRFEVVYAWGVLHHTGAMWDALANACGTVADGGLLLLGIYDDQGWRSRAWRVVKRRYVRSPPPLRPLLVAAAVPPLVLTSLRWHLRAGDIGGFLRRWSGTGRRGMSGWHDLVDWVGGYPFEVAKPDEVLQRCGGLGLVPRAVRTTTGRGNNQFVFARPAPRAAYAGSFR